MPVVQMFLSGRWGAEHISRLKDKILEESQEVVGAETLEALTEELGDLLEVIYALGGGCRSVCAKN